MRWPAVLTALTAVPGCGDTGMRGSTLHGGSAARADRGCRTSEQFGASSRAGEDAATGAPGWVFR